jgi:hypothetical protein
MTLGRLGSLAMSTMTTDVLSGRLGSKAFRRVYGERVSDKIWQGSLHFQGLANLD